MHPTKTAVTVVLRAAWIGLAACSLGTEPGSDNVPGRRLLDLQETGIHWAWLPNGSEVAYLTRFDWPYDGPPAHIKAVDASTGAIRTVLPPQGSTSVFRHRIVSPYAYFFLNATLHRTNLSGENTPEALPATVGGVFNWSVSDDHQWLAWADSTLVIRVNLASGARDTITTDVWMEGRTVFLAPDGSGILVADWGGEPANVFWIDVGSGSVTVGQAPCMLWDGTQVRWEAETPVLYLACGGEFMRHVVGAGSSRLAFISGGEDGAWSPALDRVSAWRRSCPGWTGAGCHAARRELYVAPVGEEPRLIGTLILDARERLDDTGPALFSPTESYVVFWLNATSPHDGLRSLRVD